MLGKRVEELENQMRSVRTKDKIQIVKTSSLDSNSSSNTTASIREDLTTPDDLEEDDGAIPDDEREPDDYDDEETELPPELDRLVNEAINELKIRDLDQTTRHTTTTSLLEGSADH